MPNEKQDLQEVDWSAEIDASAFGEMTQIAVSSIDLTVRVMCWHLTQSNMMGGRAIVNIENDDEARDILEKEGIPAPTIGATGLHTVSMGFQAGDDLILAVQLSDRDLRLLAIRAMHMKFMRWDPPVGPMLQKYYDMVRHETERQKAEQPKH